MKKGYFVLCSVMVAAVCMLLLSGCSEQKKLIGSWKSDIDITDEINEGFEQNEEMADYIKVDNFSMAMNLEFKEDGTYKMYIDEDSINESVDSLKDGFLDGVKQYFEDQFADSGLGMSADDILEASGTSMDDIAEQLDDEMMDAVDSLIDGVEKEGKFEARDGKLYMSDGIEFEIDEDVYATYEISDGELKILEQFGGDEDESEYDLLPMTFERAD